ncbi:MAG: DUF1761 domain-containing protein [Spirochaetales bacterium]|jgi:hypothetical protein|nr:DUF1761 domain-containing protein [Spirochaetales bacterium]
MDFGSVNYIAVLLGAVLNMILGMLWYGPLFGKLWLKTIDKNKDDIQGSPLMYVGSFIAALVAALTLSLVIQAFGSTGFFDGLLIGVVVWLGFVATVTLTYSIFEGPPLRVWLIFIGYQLVIFAVEGGVFAIW